jgi:hypothetical protein
MIKEHKACAILIAVTGTFLLFTGILIGKSFSKVVSVTSLEQNSTSTDSVSPLNIQKNTIFDLANEYKPYSIGESRELNEIDTQETSLSVELGVMHDVVSIFDEKSKINYRLFRVGYDDAPPTYHAGRIIVEVTDSSGGPTRWLYFVTEIADMNSISKLQIQGNNLIAACSPSNNTTTCTYSISYQKDISRLLVKKLK